MKRAYTSTEIQKLFGIGRPVFQAWLGDGILDPSISRSTVQGEPNIFSDADAVRVGVMVLMTRQGYPRKEAKTFLHGIDEMFSGLGIGREGYLTQAFVLLQSNLLKSTVLSDEMEEFSIGQLYKIKPASDMRSVCKAIEGKFEMTEIINLELIRAAI